ncbi:tetratricopeptide repeat protein [Streptomyces regalis]|uniref:ATP/GTP-binding protein n=1 Tax=Streptomyces regalis TaxID=68262 RepID=A0A117MRN5_9ACTN|nr:tetratricopeptide repeat protein [Streptomyces regalis]KUL32081.1 ATP/GTP-binding protein [Streptomyces regalis]
MNELGARASGQGRIFQTTGDQHIQEHHHHYDPGAGPLFGGTRPASPAGPDSVRMPLVGRPPGILRNREELRELLAAAVAGPGGDAHVVHGMGGCGKTALAYWLFTEAVRSHGRVGLWVNASERMSLRAGMLAVAGDRGASAGELAAAATGQRAAADLVWHYLDHSCDPWLLVLDNADDPGVLEDGAWLRTSPRGTVLITTRHAGSPLWRGPGVSRHALGVLPLDDAAQVLCDLAPDTGDLDSARKVAERLGRLPLALTLAGSHLAHQLLESWSMDEYDRKLAEESTAIVDRGTAGHGGNQSRHLVGRTWQLSLDTLTEQGLPEATTLLRLLSLLAADPVPLEVLAPVARAAVAIEGLEPARVEPALRGLLDHSLAELVVVADAVRCVRAHGVLLDSVAAGIPRGQRPALAEAAAGLLEAALPETAENRTRLTLLAPHTVALLKAEPGERTAALAVRVVRAVHEAGDGPATLALACDVVRVTDTALGALHPVTLDAQDAQAKALTRMGRWAESAELFSTVIERREQTLGPDHPDTLRSYRYFRQPLALLSRMEEAEHFLCRALDGQRRLLGENSPETLDTWTSLLELLSATGRERELETEAAALIDACERELPAGHPTTAVARHSYADSLRELGRHAEADPLTGSVLADHIRNHGPDHPLTLTALCLKARVAHGLGRFDEAVGTLKEVIERRERVLGPEHPLVVENHEWLTAWQAEAES